MSCLFVFRLPSGSALCREHFIAGFIFELRIFELVQTRMSIHVHPDVHPDMSLERCPSWHVHPHMAVHRYPSRYVRPECPSRQVHLHMFKRPHRISNIISSHAIISRFPGFPDYMALLRCNGSVAWSPEIGAITSPCQNLQYVVTSHALFIHNKTWVSWDVSNVWTL